MIFFFEVRWYIFHGKDGVQIWGKHLKIVLSDENNVIIVNFNKNIPPKQKRYSKISDSYFLKFSYEMSLLHHEMTP